MKSFRTLDLAVEFSKSACQLKFKGHLREQLERAATSIALNLSEGNAKGSARDKRSYFQNAYGSLRECQTIFKLMNIEDKQILGQADQLGAFLYRLVNSNLKNSPNWKKGHSDI